jgi:hypothetical protein
MAHSHINFLGVGNVLAGLDLLLGSSPHPPAARRNHATLRRTCGAPFLPISVGSLSTDSRLIGPISNMEGLLVADRRFLWQRKTPCVGAAPAELLANQPINNSSRTAAIACPPCRNQIAIARGTASPQLPSLTEWCRHAHAVAN